MIERVVGIVLSRKKHGEADALLQIISEGGEKLSLKLHGIFASKKRSAIAAEPGTIVQFIYYTEGQFHSVKEAEVIERFTSLKDDYKSLVLLAAILEVTELSLNGPSAPEVYILLKSALEFLAFRTTSIEERTFFALLSFYKIRICSHLGIMADPQTCAECGKELRAISHWMMPELRFLCENCGQNPTAEHFGFADFMARSLSSKFKNVMSAYDSVTQDGFYNLERNLNLVLETFFQRPLKGAKEWTGLVKT